MNSEHLRFPGSGGQSLAARLDSPDVPLGAPVAYALFAHCFTCSKDLKAAGWISRALIERGIAVLRFDFTGIGESEGELAGNGLSSNVDDLVAAADFLRRERASPRCWPNGRRRGFLPLSLIHESSVNFADNVTEG